jgi:hypothetical protein
MAGNHGGARPGAGRKPGSTNSANSASKIKERITEQHAARKNADTGKPWFDDDVLNSDPLSTIELYRKVHLQDFASNGDVSALKEAMMAAREAAPYFHAKRQSIVQENINLNPAEEKTEAELMADVFGSTARPNVERPN